MWKTSKMFSCFLLHLCKGSSTNHVDGRGGRGVTKMSMFVHMGGGGSRPLSMWIMIPTFLHLISGICKYWMR